MMQIYFSGIGGVGLGPLAEIALDAGYGVIGSDANHSLMTAQLEQRGVTISTDQSGDFLRAQHDAQPIDWLVYTSALPEDHPELQTARQHGIKTTKRDELLAHIINEKNLKLIAVAGTHGKTTTTGMLVWCFKQLGIPVSYSIGTTISFGPSGLFDPESSYFVYECDEFDRNFLQFYPHISLVTSIEYDHPDTYPTEAEYMGAFRQFGAQSKHIVSWHQYAPLFDAEKTTFVSEITPTIGLHGEHNRRNGTLVLETLRQLQLGDKNTSPVQPVLDSFPGTSRRFEMLSENLYSDYGHTPTEIAATLQMARELSDDVVLVYQPHQNIRQHEIRDQYTDEVFKDAKTVYWLPTYLSRENPDLAVLTPAELTKNLHNIQLTELDDDLWKTIQTARKEGKLVLCMGAGTIDGWVREKLKHTRNSVDIF